MGSFFLFPLFKNTLFGNLGSTRLSIVQVQVGKCTKKKKITPNKCYALCFFLIYSLYFGRDEEAQKYTRETEKVKKDTKK